MDTARRTAAGLALLLTAACGSGPGEGSSTGRVSDVQGRLCLQSTPDDGVCFGATPEQLGGVQLGSCVEVTYTPVDGRVPDADAVRAVDAACPGPG